LISSPFKTFSGGKEKELNRVTQFIIGLIAIALALGAGFYGRTRYLKEVSTYQVPVPAKEVSTYQVPVPAKVIPAYTILKSEQFQMRDMPRTMESLPYYQSIQALDGMISTVPLLAGLPIAQSNAVPVAQFRLVDAAFEVLSIPVEPVSAVGGQIRIGEHVNLYQVSEEVAVTDISVTRGNNQPGYKIKLIAGSILVVDVRNAQGVAAETSQKSDGNSSFNSSPQTKQVQILTLFAKNVPQRTWGRQGYNNRDRCHHISSGLVRVARWGDGSEWLLIRGPAGNLVFDDH
jgi:Flp pilus assembly protein CpaB